MLFVTIIFYCYLVSSFFFSFGILRIRIILYSSPSLAQTLLLSVSGFGCYRSGGPTLELTCWVPAASHVPWRLEGCMADIWAGRHCHHLWLWAGHWGRTQLWSNMLNAAAHQMSASKRGLWTGDLWLWLWWCLWAMLNIQSLSLNARWELRLSPFGFELFRSLLMQLLCIHSLRLCCEADSPDAHSCGISSLSGHEIPQTTCSP